MSGPYGTVLEERAKQLEVPDLSKSVNVTQGGIYRAETLAIARGYLDKGANVATTNTFGTRGLLRAAQPELYRQVVTEHVGLVRQALEGFHNRNLVVSLGPYGDCYKPEDAPSDEKDARDFHSQQLAVVKDLLLSAGIDAVVFETLCTGREAIGATMAAKELKIPVIPSFVVDRDAKLFSGEPLVEVLRQIDDITGSYPLGFSINCCPVSGAFQAIADSNGKRDRLIMAYPNSSERDPRELEEIDGVVHLHDNGSTAQQLVELVRRNASIKIIGGCCGFDHDDIGVISAAVRTHLSF